MNVTRTSYKNIHNKFQLLKTKQTNKYLWPHNNICLVRNFSQRHKFFRPRNIWIHQDQMHSHQVGAVEFCTLLFSHCNSTQDNWFVINLFHTKFMTQTDSRVLNETAWIGNHSREQLQLTVGKFISTFDLLHWNNFCFLKHFF